MLRILLASISYHGSSYIPYSSGCIISHCNKDTFIKNNYEFLEPEYRSEALKHPDFIKKLEKADILGLTNYAWNQSYNDLISVEYKKINPNGIIAYGGPNVPEDYDSGTEYIDNRFYIDICFPGAAGEELFKNFLINYPENHINMVAGAYTHDYFNVSSSKKLLANIPLPTPYIDGVFDSIFKKEKYLIAPLETNRGCPYSCSFCDWGGSGRGKLNQFDEDKVRNTIKLLFEKDNVKRIQVVDANFGILKRDLDLAKYMSHLGKDRKDQMRINFAGYAKNGSKNLIDIFETLDENILGSTDADDVGKLSFQSHHPEVLKINKRSNIDNEKLMPIVEHYNKKNIGVHAEMMLLPGETEERMLYSIAKNVEIKVLWQRWSVTWVLPNTLLSEKKFQDEHNIKLKKILIPHSLYHKSYKEVNESRSNAHLSNCDFNMSTEFMDITVINECKSFNEKEYMKIFDCWFWFNTLYNSNLARDNIIKDSRSVQDQYYSFMDNIGNMPILKRLLEEYRECAYNTVVKKEEVTKIKDLRYAAWFVKYTYRLGEMWDIYHNQPAVEKELRLVYPDYKLNLKPVENESKLYNAVTWFQHQ